MPNFARRSVAAIADRDGCQVCIAISCMMLPLTTPTSSLWKGSGDDSIEAVMF